MPPADGAVPPIPRNALSVSLCTPLPQGLRRDERSLISEPDTRWSKSVLAPDAQVTFPSWLDTGVWCSCWWDSFPKLWDLDSPFLIQHLPSFPPVLIPT